jgi:hypothetical protein
MPAAGEMRLLVCGLLTMSSLPSVGVEMTLESSTRKNKRVVVLKVFEGMRYAETLTCGLRKKREKRKRKANYLPFRPKFSKKTHWPLALCHW